MGWFINRSVVIPLEEIDSSIPYGHKAGLHTKYTMCPLPKNKPINNRSFGIHPETRGREYKPRMRLGLQKVFELGPILH